MKQYARLQKTPPAVRVKYSLIAPFYNEAENVMPFAERVAAVLEGLKASYEIIMVDDCSSDATAAFIEEAKKRYPAIRSLRHEKNSGQSAGLRSGFMTAHGEIIITMDGDCQNDPSDIPVMLEKLSEADAVVGVRTGRKDTVSKILASKIANGFRRLMLGDRFQDVGCGLKVFNTRCIDGLLYFNGFHRFLPILFERNGCVVAEMPVRHCPRRFGSSKYNNFSRMWKGLADCLKVRRYLNYRAASRP